MLSVAMKSGRLEVLSEEIAKYYQQKSENLMDRFLVFFRAYDDFICGVFSFVFGFRYIFTYVRA